MLYFKRLVNNDEMLNSNSSGEPGVKNEITPQLVTRDHENEGDDDTMYNTGHKTNIDDDGMTKRGISHDPNEQYSQNENT